MSGHSNNYITAQSKSPSTSRNDAPITIDLADNNLEVRGFGQPIPIALAKKMVTNYFNAYKEVEKFIALIDENKGGEFDVIKKNDGILVQFNNLKEMMNEDNHIVSGVFGKEIILHTLAQKNCEGIRYMLGKDSDGKMTVILLGVKETAYEKEENNYTTKTDKDSTRIRKSEALPSKQYFQDIRPNTASKPKDPTVPEVHLASLTMRELIEELRTKFDGSGDASDVLFGEF